MAKLTQSTLHLGVLFFHRQVEQDADSQSPLRPMDFRGNLPVPAGSLGLQMTLRLQQRHGSAK